MEGFSNEEVKEFLREMGLPESKLLNSGEISNIFSLLGIKPAFHLDGTRVLTPYEILGVLPKFSDDGKEVPIVFVIKNRTSKIGRYDGINTTFVCKHKKVRDQKTTLEELKAKYKRAVLNDNDEEAEDLFKMIDGLSGGNAKDLLGSFFNYTKYYKRLKKQLILDLFAHFFLLYIYSMITAAKGGIVRKNKIFKPFKNGEIEMTSAPKQLGDESGVLSVTETLKPENFGINNLKSITIEQDTSNVEEMLKVKVSDNGSNIQASFAQKKTETKPELPKTQEIKKEDNKKSEKSKDIEPQKPKTFTEKIMEFLSFGEIGSNSKQLAFDEEFNVLTPNFLKEDKDFNLSDENFETEQNIFEANQDELVAEKDCYARKNIYDDLNEQQYSAVQNQLGEQGLNLIQNIDDDSGFAENELQRESVLKKKKRVNVKRFGSEFNEVTKETKLNDEENSFEQSYDFEG